MTIVELQEWLIDNYDINDIMEMLKVAPEELVEAFSYKIEENYDTLLQEAEDEVDE